MKHDFRQRFKLTAAIVTIVASVSLTFSPAVIASDPTLLKLMSPGE